MQVHKRPADRPKIEVGPPVKTPHGAIVRVFNRFGLRRGKDYRIHTVKRFGKRIGVRVATWDVEVDELLAQRVEHIEKETRALGFPFTVEVHRTRSEQAIVTVAYDERREE